MFPAAITFGSIAFMVSIYQSLHHGWYPTVFLHTTMYLFALAVLIFRHRIPVRLIFSFLLGLMSISIIHSLYNKGLAGEGMMTFIVLCVFSGAFFGIRAGIIAVASGAFSIAIMAVLICAGMIATNSDIPGLSSEPVTWITQITLALVYVVPLVLIINYMRERIINSLSVSKAMNERLQEEIKTRAIVEDKLRESEANYRNIFYHATEGIFQATQEGKLLHVNPSLARMGGFSSPEEMIESNTNLHQKFFANEDDRLKIRKLLQQQGSAEGFETTMFKRDKSIIWVSITLRTICDDKGNRLFVEGIIEDVTKRKSAEKALYESELKYRSVVENSLVAFYIIQDSLFRFVNNRFCILTGYDYDELIDKLGIIDIMHPDDMNKIYGETPDGHEEYNEIKAVKKDGGIINIKVMRNILIYNGRPAIFGAFIDITKEKILETKLLRSQKMEAIGTFAGGIAHDFNNILTALMGYGTILQMQMEDANPLRQYADHILSASEKAVNLTQSLLAFSRLQPVILRPVNINAVVQGTEKLLRRLITEDITLITEVAPEKINILADSTQIDQILFNLVTNARDAMPKGGILKLSTKIADLDDEFILTNGFGKKGRYALLSVSDNGIGMDENTKKKIFDPFYTTKEVGKGTGLGLSTTYGIVKQHYGYILLNSEPGQGTDFQIYFPLIKADVHETEKTPVNIRVGKETVLAAEDNDDVRAFIKDILEQYGYRVIEAVDGDDAVNKFREHEEISLVILDAIMPKKNGKDVYNTIKKIRFGVSVFYISGYTQEVLLAKGVIEQGVDFISKPISPSDFLIKVGEVLDRKKN